MLGFESGMAGDTERSRVYMLFLLVMACISLTVSDGPTCPMEILENTTLDIKPAVTKGARGADPVFMDTENSCMEKCCSSKTTTGAWNCSLVIFDSRKTGKHPNCYLFNCPTDEACPTKPTIGVTSFRVIQENGQAEKSSSRSKDTKPTYVNVKKEKPMSLDSEPSAAKKTKEHVSEDGNMIKSITSKILDRMENIEKQLDKMDHSLEEEEKPEEKKMEKPSSNRKPSETANNVAHQPISNPIIEPEPSIKIATTTWTTTTTPLPSTTTTTLPANNLLITTTPLPTTTLLITTTLMPTTTSKTTTTTATLPTTSTTTTTHPTTTSSRTTMLSTTTSNIAMLVATPVERTFTTTSTTLATTTSVENHITTTSTTKTDTTTTVALPPTPAVTAAKSTHLNPKHVNNNNNKVDPLTTTPKPEKPKTPLPKLQTITKEKARKMQVSSHVTPKVVVDDSASLKNVNKDFHGTENKVLENIVNSDSQSGDKSGLVAALVFGVGFFLVILFLVSRRALEAMRRRHYSRLDYLINGMYIDT